MIPKRYFFLAAMVLLLGSCKDELTLPAKVHFDFGMVVFQNPAPTKDVPKNNSPNRYTINKGELTLESIEFDGRRNQGKDVYFKSNFSENVVSQLHSQTSNVRVEFDIPQGEYNRVDITLHLGAGADAPFKLEGQFSYGQSASIPIYFEYAYTDEITIRGKSKQGANIILSKNNVTSAKVVVDTEFLFRFLNPGLIASAVRVTQAGEEVILINQLNNVEIFNQVASRFSSSISVVFE